MTRTKRQMQVALALAVAMVGSACGSEVLRPLATTSGVDEVAAPGEPVAPQGDGPRALTCVTAATQEAGELMPHVERVHLVDAGDGTLSTSVARGPQFPWREGEWLLGAEAKQERAFAQIGSRVSLTTGGLVVEAKATDATRTLFTGVAVTGAGAVALTCWDPEHLVFSPWGGSPGPTLFHARYDHATGACADADGRPALNKVPVEVVRETGFGECADLRGARLNDADFGGPTLSGWYLAGARLEGAQLFFADLTDASLAGADVDGLVFGYATLTGFTDGFTAVPDACTTTESPWAGAVVECVQ